MKHQEQAFSHVSFHGYKYGITFAGDRFGVCKGGYGRVKYMPVNWKVNAPHYFPQLLKSRLNMMDTAEGLYNNLLACAKLQTFLPECVQICEHVLKNGHPPR